MGFLSNLFGFGNKREKILQFLEKGALIIDVRSKAEFDRGHIKGSVNIPLDRLDENIKKLKKNGKPLLLCCESGMRSASAASVLQRNGFPEVINGGAWRKLEKIILVEV